MPTKVTLVEVVNTIANSINILESDAKAFAGSHEVMYSTEFDVQVTQA